jgi:hypothetical protein
MAIPGCSAVRGMANHHKFLGTSPANMGVPKSASTVSPRGTNVLAVWSGWRAIFAAAKDLNRGDDTTLARSVTCWTRLSLSSGLSATDQAPRSLSLFPDEPISDDSEDCLHRAQFTDELHNLIMTLPFKESFVIFGRHAEHAELQGLRFQYSWHRPATWRYGINR